MAFKELLYLDHITIDGDGFDGDWGEARLALRVTLLVSGGEPEVTDVRARDLDSRAVYDREELERRASPKGCDQVAEAIEEAVRLFHLGIRRSPCRCMLCRGSRLHRRAA